jgi:hypothetical protein
MRILLKREIRRFVGKIVPLVPVRSQMNTIDIFTSYLFQIVLILSAPLVVLVGLLYVPHRALLYTWQIKPTKCTNIAYYLNYRTYMFRSM